MMHFRYAWYVIRHKWFVFLACCQLGVPWLGLIHDLSKLLPGEWGPYAQHFYGPRARQVRDKTGYYKPTDTGDPTFDVAWLHHARRNKHHWLWWALPTDDGGLKLFPVPDRYRREMLADWRGASMAQGHGPDVSRWYAKNKHKMYLHPDTRAWIEAQL